MITLIIGLLVGGIVGFLTCVLLTRSKISDMEYELGELMKNHQAAVHAEGR